MNTEAASLATKLAAIVRAVEDARAHQHEAGLATRYTRKLPADVLRVLRRWQESTALRGDTMQPKTGARAPQAGSQRQAHKITACRREEPAVPVSPTVAVRVPTDLRQQAEAYGRERRWTFGEVVRVGLEQLVDYQGEVEQDQPTERSHGLSR